MIDELRYEELERFLREWRSLQGEFTYDFVGMFHLFRACLQNLMEHSTAEDWSAVSELLTSEEKAFLAELARLPDGPAR